MTEVRKQLSWEREGEDWVLLLDGKKLGKAPKLVQDSTYPGMWRLEWPNGSRSDMVNLTRAKDAGFAHADRLLDPR